MRGCFSVLSSWMLGKWGISVLQGGNHFSHFWDFFTLLFATILAWNYNIVSETWHKESGQARLRSPRGSDKHYKEPRNYEMHIRVDTVNFPLKLKLGLNSIFKFNWNNHTWTSFQYAGEYKTGTIHNINHINRNGTVFLGRYPRTKPKMGKLMQQYERMFY